MIQVVQELLRVTLANSTAFQTLVGAADATEALDRIYHDACPLPASGGDRYTLDEMIALRPCAIVFTMTENGWETTHDATGDDCWRDNGRLGCKIFRNVPDDDRFDLSKVDTDFRTVIGDIIYDFKSMAETAGRLAIQHVTVSGPYRTDPRDIQAEGDAQEYELIITWGPER